MDSRERRESQEEEIDNTLDLDAEAQWLCDTLHTVARYIGTTVGHDNQ